MGTAIVLLALVAFATAYDVVLDTKYGKIGGFKYTTSSKTMSDIILNIPFAEPPVGALRFEKPQLPRAWNGTRNGTDFGFQCVPHAQVAVLPAAVFKNISEDCLTLNVMRPSTTPPAGGWPILVWIHGGGYEIGSQTLYGYKGLANIFNPQGVMIVSIQYRIGIYGFMSNGDNKNFQGNYGLFDQALALKFINENAARWGGNGKTVTLLGQSAGAASVGQLSISPYSRQYVKGTVAASGSLNAVWARGQTVPKYSKQVMTALNCTTSGKAAKECMKTKTITQIFAAVNETGISGTDYHFLKYGPRLDGDFFPKDPLEMIRENPPAPAIIGVGNRDASYFTYLGFSQYIQPFATPVAVWKNQTRTTLENGVKKFVLANDFGSLTPLALSQVMNEYVTKNLRDMYDYYMVQFEELVSTITFYMPAYDEAQARMDAGSDVYLYRLDHYNEALYPSNLTTQIMKGSPHTNEYIYWFEMSVMPKYDTSTPEETIVKEILQQTVINFAKTGIPTSTRTKWEKSNRDDMNFLKIDKKPQMLNGFYRDEANFWHKMRSYGYDLSSDQPTIVGSTAPPSAYAIKMQNNNYFNQIFAN